LEPKKIDETAEEAQLMKLVVIFATTTPNSNALSLHIRVMQWCIYRRRKSKPEEGSTTFVILGDNDAVSD